MATASIGLMCFTLGTHRIPIALWHQADDAPRHIVTWGAYARIRHPFYASFLLLLAACLLACPHPITAAAFVSGCPVLNGTAAREETRLRASEFGADYAAYMARTGRFFPRLHVMPVLPRSRRHGPRRPRARPSKRRPSAG